MIIATTYCKFKQAIKFLPVSLMLLGMCSCNKEEAFQAKLTPEEITYNEEHFFDHADRADRMKRLVIDLLKTKNQQDGFVLKYYAASGEKPLWDDDLTITTDTSTRLLIPVYSQLEKNLSAVMYFEWPHGKDSIIWAKVEAPPPVDDTSFKWDPALLFDYFRTKLQLPTQRRVMFVEPESQSTQESSSIQLSELEIEVNCRIVCAYIGNAEHLEFKGCSNYCTISYIITDEATEILDTGGDSGGNDKSPKEFLVSVVASPAEAGSVSGGGIYKEGQLCLIAAQPKTGFILHKWSGTNGDQNNYLVFELEVDRAQTYTAHFVAASSYSPCSQRDSVKLNSEIAKVLDSLKNDAANLTIESGKYMTDGPAGQKYRSARGGKDSVNFPIHIGANYKWMFHSHWGNNGFVPSIHDLWVLLGIVYQKKRIADYADFVYGIVNKNGTAYGLMISNQTRLQQFIMENNLYTSQDWYEKLDKELKEVGSDAQKAEKIFAERLSNSGLSILKGTNINTDSINWQQIEYDQSNDNVVSKPCN